MKKALFIFAISILAPAAVFAGSSDRVGKWDAGINVAGGFMTEDGTGDNYYLGGNVSYGVYSWLGVGISAGWADSKFDTIDPNGETAKGGRVAMIPIFADFIFRVPASAGNDFVPYGVLGLGGIFTNLHGNGDATRFGQTVDNNDGFACKLGAGVDWFANDNWIYNLEAGYVFTTADIQVTNNDGSGSNDGDLSYFYMGGGVKWLG